MLFLNGIGIKRAKREPLVSAENALITLENGIEGDVRGNGGRERRRQVTLISNNQWRDVCSDMGWDPALWSWMLRRAGLCIGGVWFRPEHIGQFLRIGEDVTLEVTGETKPCERMDEIAPGLKDVLAESMRGGVTARIIQPGRITLWDPVRISSQNPL